MQYPRRLNGILSLALSVTGLLCSLGLCLAIAFDAINLDIFVVVWIVAAIELPGLTLGILVRTSRAGRMGAVLSATVLVVWILFLAVAVPTTRTEYSSTSCGRFTVESTANIQPVTSLKDNESPLQDRNQGGFIL